MIIVDVREPEEYAKGHVPGAINIPPMQIMNGTKALADVPKDEELVLYCVSGSRSNVSMQMLKQQGFTNVVNGVNMHHVMAKYGPF